MYSSSRINGFYYCFSTHSVSSRSSFVNEYYPENIVDNSYFYFVNLQPLISNFFNFEYFLKASFNMPKLLSPKLLLPIISTFNSH